MRLNYGRAGATGLMYDGHDLSDMFQIVDVSIPLLPTISVATHELAQRPGAYFASRKVGTREVKVKLRLDAETRDPMEIFHAWREFTGIFNKTEPKRLQLKEELYCNALLVGNTPIADEAYYGVVELTFVCFDPYIYGTEHEIALSNNSTATFNVRGACQAFPRLTLTASATSVTVTNMVTGEYVAIPNTSSGASIAIDMEKQLSTIGGAYAPVDLLSDYFSVEGSAQIKVVGASGTLRYEERYL